VEVRRRWQARAGSVRSIRQGHVSEDPRLNIRLASEDLEAIQNQALAEGLPYQTLIASLLHKYATGRVKEVS
jgi:predicted DNA binding CopG/RHH family protein